MVTVSTRNRKPTKDLTQEETLARFPALAAHLICESLGYFSPKAATNALLAHAQGLGFACEWYVHMVGYGNARLVEVGRSTIGKAYANRQFNQGYMRSYESARALIARELQGYEQKFGSW